MTQDDILRELATVLAVGVAMQWLAWRLRLPSILLLLSAGLLVGPLAPQLIGLSLVNPDQLFGSLLLPMTSVSVALILFEGGLSLDTVELNRVGRVVWRLITIGGLVRWLLAAGLAWGLGLAEWRLALLLGAVLVVTGPTVIGPLLEHVRPRGPVGPVLKWEGIVIDPIGATLAVLVFEVITAGDMSQGVHDAALSLIKTAVFGCALGAGGAALLVVAHRRQWIPEFLENAVTLALVLVAFVGSNALQHESGLLAVTVMGIAVGNALKGSAHRIVEFKETLRGLLISCLFVVLAARVDLASLTAAFGWRSLAFFGLLVLVVRPAGVLVSTLGSSLTWPERAFVACLAPRGIVAAAVSAVFALRLAERGFAQAQDLAALTFVVIIGSVALYGLTAAPLARRLGLAESEPQGALLLGAHDWARDLAEALAQAGAAVKLIDSNLENVARAQAEGLAAVHANVLAESVHDVVDLGDVAQLIALTSNDAVNAMAAEALRPVVGSGRAFLLSPRARPGDARESSSPAEPQRILCGLTFDEVDRRYERGHRFRTATLGAGPGLEAWRAEQGDDACLVAVVSAGGRLELAVGGEPKGLRPGDRLVGLAPPREGEVVVSRRVRRAEG